MTEDIRIEDYDYQLPEDKIAKHPLRERDRCKLLLRRPDGKISHRVFRELAGLLPPGSLLVQNDTRVINARLAFHKPTGSRIEIFLLEPEDPSDYAIAFQTRGRCAWQCLIGNNRKWKEESLTMKLNVVGHETLLKARRLDGEGRKNSYRVEFCWDDETMTFADVIEAAGCIPIPPYLNRETEESDSEDYQTVYAKVKGSVAAPTAGLHFTEYVFDDLRAHGIETARLTLHVGAGTFRPVKSETIGDHEMHTETFSVSLDLIETLIKWRKEGRSIVATGTTTVRTLESLPYIGARILRGEENMHVDQWEAYSEEAKNIDTIRSLEAIRDFMEKKGIRQLTASTAIMIAPGFQRRVTDAMVTNFHQPKSTLLLLVSSFLGNGKEGGDWREIYEEALNEGYRFLSYGDACLLFPDKREIKG